MGAAARIWTTAFVAVVVAAVGLAWWTASNRPNEAPAATDSDVLVVAAAASLTDAFTDLAAAFDREQGDVAVSLTVAGSATLAEQVRGGAPVDVIATADERTLDLLEQDGLLAGAPRPLATNELRLAVPTGDGADDGATVGGLDALADESLFVGLCAAGQPCGDYAREALAAAGLDPDAVVDTEEADVRALLAKVTQGELDAGIVYATDVRAAAGAVTGVAIDGPIATYPIAVLRDAPNPSAAEAFVRFATGATGRQILRDHGFGLPS